MAISVWGSMIDFGEMVWPPQVQENSLADIGKNVKYLLSVRNFAHREKHSITLYCTFSKV